MSSSLAEIFPPKVHDRTQNLICAPHRIYICAGKCTLSNSSNASLNSAFCRRVISVTMVGPATWTRLCNSHWKHLVDFHFLCRVIHCIVRFLLLTSFLRIPHFGFCPDQGGSSTIPNLPWIGGQGEGGPDWLGKFPFRKSKIWGSSLRQRLGKELLRADETLELWNWFDRAIFLRSGAWSWPCRAVAKPLKHMAHLPSNSLVATPLCFSSWHQ